MCKIQTIGSRKWKSYTCFSYCQKYVIHYNISSNINLFFSEEWLLTYWTIFYMFLRLLWWCRRRIFWQKRLRNPKDTPHQSSEFSFRTKPFFNSIQDHPNTSTYIISFVFYTFIYNSFLDLSVVQILLFMRLMFECIRILE